MNSNQKFLNGLLENSGIRTSIKEKIIIQVLRKYYPINNIKAICKSLLSGDLTQLNDVQIKELTDALLLEKKDDIDIKLELEMEIARRKEAEKKLLLVEEELKAEKNKAKLAMERMIKITESLQLIQVPDEDIDELYRLYLKNGEKRYKDAIRIDNIIVKSYYELK